MSERLALPREDRDIHEDYLELVDRYGVAPVDAARRLGTTITAMDNVVEADRASARRQAKRAEREGTP